MTVLDHIGVRVADHEASRRFYATVLGALGLRASHADESLVEYEELAFGPAEADRPVTRGLHLGFAAPSREHVDAFWRAGTEAGFRDDGAPGPRPEYGPDYYGGFLLDPDGNSAEAVHHEGTHDRDVIDHLWIRVADLGAAKLFYEAVAPFGGFALKAHHPEDHLPERVRFAGESGSFTLVAGGTPTEHVHLAFPASDNATVDAFHRELTAAGYADNGGPGERAIYHPGDYGAFVCDPDGNNVEVVNHNRG